MRVVLSIGSNMGDRLARLQSVVDGLGGALRAVSPVYETDAWGGVEQGPFLNAVLIADDPHLDGHGWLRRAHDFERAADRVRDQRWGPRTLDVDLVTCHDGEAEVIVARRRADAAAPACTSAGVRAGPLAGRRSGRRR